MHKEGCTYGQLQALELSHLKEDIGEIKQDAKDLKRSISLLSEEIQAQRAILEQHKVYRTWLDKTREIVVAAVVGLLAGLLSKRI
ncbi:MAG: hypothetical protein ACM3UP_00635 [Methanocella sp.]